MKNKVLRLVLASWYEGLVVVLVLMLFLQKLAYINMTGLLPSDVIPKYQFYQIWIGVITIIWGISGYSILTGIDFKKQCKTNNVAVID